MKPQLWWQVQPLKYIQEHVHYHVHQELRELLRKLKTQRAKRSNENGGQNVVNAALDKETAKTKVAKGLVTVGTQTEINKVEVPHEMASVVIRSAEETDKMAMTREIRTREKKNVANAALAIRTNG